MPRRSDPVAFEAAEHRRRFGDQVRRLRAERGWTQEKLAEAAAMDRSYLADIERGHRNPTLDVIYRIAGGIEVEVSALFPAPRT